MSKGLHKECCRKDFKVSNFDEKIRWHDLSIPLKIAIVMAWFVGSLYLLIFLIGLISGVFGN